MIRVTVWNEFFHEQEQGDNLSRKYYPNGIHEYIADFLRPEFEVTTTTLADHNLAVRPDCGITKELIDNTDVLIWWSHFMNDAVSDEAAAIVTDAVRRGMGVIFLHSGHNSKPFRSLMGTTCSLNWRLPGCKEKLWPVNASHPIVKNVQAPIKLEEEEIYVEPFGIPEPDELVFLGSYADGEAFRSGCCFKRQPGKIFYFQPGHEACPTYYNLQVQTVIKNAVKWCYNDDRGAGTVDCLFAEKLTD